MRQAIRDVTKDFPTPPFPLTTPITFFTELAGFNFSRKLCGSFVLLPQFAVQLPQSCVQFYAFLHIIIVWLNLISRLPILYGLNKIAGAVLGLAEALIFIWVGALVLTLFSGSEIGKSMITQINGSIWLTWLYDHNMLSYLVVGLVKSVL